MGATVDGFININYETRIIYLANEINKSTIGEICNTILHINNTDEKEERTLKDYVRQPIHIYIESNGGDVDDGMALIDIIQASKTPIYTYCVGYAISAAFTIFIAGHKRFIYSSAYLLYHAIRISASGLMAAVIDRVPHFNRTMDVIENFIVTRTNITKEKLELLRVAATDWIIYPEEALKLNIADEII